MMNSKMMMAAALMAGAMGSVSAFGAITGVAGQTTWLLTPPAAATPSSLLGPNAFAWDEKQNLFVTNVMCDLTNNPGNSSSPVFGLVSGNVDSHFIHFQQNTAATLVNGQVTFAGKIRGVMFMQNTLDITDIPLGSPSTIYPTGYGWRGLNASSFFSINNNVLTFHFDGPIPTPDILQLRVLTEHVVPAPGVMAMVGMGGLIAARRRRA
ncbi:MAG: hypothetical protein J0L78_12865 [Planctomycetes bacterium]|nr:hypothetical protein [Planctomycetota bacterium]